MYEVSVLRYIEYCVRVWVGGCLEVVGWLVGWLVGWFVGLLVCWLVSWWDKKATFYEACCQR